MTVVAVVGCGRIAMHVHFPALSELKDVRIKYACDIILQKAQTAKEQFPKIENVVADYHTVLSDKEVDAVFVLTHNSAHYTVTMDALRAKKHVMCEKPIAVDYKSSLKMAQEAKKQDRILNIGVCNRYNATVETIKDYYDRGELGEVYHVYCSFRSFRSIPGLGGAFTTKSMSGGGVLIDWGVHFFDLILYILGNPRIKNLTCDAYSQMAKDMDSYKYVTMWAEDTKDTQNGVNDVEDFITGHIRTEKSSISFNGAWAQNIQQDEMFIDFMGDKAGIRMIYGGKFTLYDANTLTAVEPEYDSANHYLRENAAFIESIKTGIKDRNNIENVLESAKLLDALYESANQKREIEFT